METKHKHIHDCTMAPEKNVNISERCPNYMQNCMPIIAIPQSRQVQVEQFLQGDYCHFSATKILSAHLPISSQSL